MYATVLFLVLILWASLPVQSLSNFTGAIILQGACKDMCDANRRSESHHMRQKPSSFDCTDTENDNCAKACATCPAGVCDEYRRKPAYVKYYSYTFNCPPLVLPKSGKCYNRCDINRFKGFRQDHSFSCKDDISPDKRGCYTCDDGDCPDIVCKPSKDKNQPYTVYNCPYDLSESVCEERCDRNRGYKNVKPYELHCSSQSDAPICKQECNQCSNYICEGDGSIYNCPHPQMIGFDECRQLCIKHRHSYNDNEYIFNCNVHYNDSTCASYCSNCPHYICDPKSGDNLIYCPKREDPSLAYFALKRKYKGKCMDRCDKSRGGGIYGFELKCGSRYSSEQEKTLCLNDCTNECPEDVCVSSNTILCQEVISEIDKIKKEKQEFKILLESEYTQKKNSIYVKHEATMITLAVLLGITILATIGFVWWATRKKRVAPEVVNGRTLSMQETHSLRELSSSATSASASTLQQQPKKKSLPPTHKYPVITPEYK